MEVVARLRRPSQDPPFSLVVELRCGNLHSSLDLGSVGKALAREGIKAVQALPTSCRLSEHASFGMKMCWRRGRCAHQVLYSRESVLNFVVLYNQFCSQPCKHAFQRVEREYYRTVKVSLDNMIVPTPSSSKL